MATLAAKTVYALSSEVVTSLGSGQHFWQALCQGKSGLRPVCEVFPRWFPSDTRAVGALPLDLDEGGRFEAILRNLLGCMDQKIFSLVDKIFVGTSLGDLIGDQAGYPQQVIKQLIPKEAEIVTSACCSGSDALSLGVLTIKAGKADLVLVLAVDSLCPAKLANHIALGTQTSTRATPFDVDRNGTSFGEGAGFLLLASPKGLEKIKETPEVEIVGVGFSSDGYDITIPDPSGRWGAHAIRQAVGGSIPDYINAHGTGTLLNDLAEAKALKLCFDLSRCLVSSTKGALGHCLGAAGLIEAIIAIKALTTGQIPPTAGLKEVDPLLGFSPLAESTQTKAPIETALSVTFGFGGVNSAIFMKRV